MDISKQLQAYEVEYYVLQDELIDSSLNDNQRMDKLEKVNSSLRKQNFDLLEELQVLTFLYSVGVHWTKCINVVSCLCQELGYFCILKVFAELFSGTCIDELWKIILAIGFDASSIRSCLIRNQNMVYLIQYCSD